MRRDTVKGKDVDTFAADAVEFCGNGHYPQFLGYMAELGYAEDEVEALTDEVNKRAGRS